jgi:hypothetical protein
MVVVRFAPTGLAHGNEPDSISARGVNDSQDSAQRIRAQGDEAWLARRIRVFDSDREGVAQGLHGMGKALALWSLRFDLAFSGSNSMSMRPMHRICMEPIEFGRTNLGAGWKWCAWGAPRVAEYGGVPPIPSYYPIRR